MSRQVGRTTNAARAPRTRRARVLAVLACLPLALAACSGGSGDASATGSATSSAPAVTTSASSPPAVTTSASGASSGSTATSSATSSTCDTSGFATSVPGDTALSKLTVSGLRVGQQPCYDRLVIDLSGDASVKPGYQVRYVPTVLDEGAGNPVTLRGAAFLRVTVGAPAYDQTGQPTYIPSNRAEAADVTGFSSFKQVAWAGSFEGMSSFGVGVREELPFKVSVLTDDGLTRLVVDVAHAAS
ncbi:MAG: hypothetical protein ABI746_10565 [Dermatophilaceae bacterium]